MEIWILPALLGLGLAAATGLKTFLPLLMLSVAVRFDLFGIGLNETVAWLDSDAALAALAVATIVELVADKIPIVDHVLGVVGTVARPIAGALAAYAVFDTVDPAVAAIAALILAAPTALAVHAAQSGVRLASTATTAGFGNPVLSAMEDVLAFVTVVVAFLAPLLIPVVLALMLWGAWRFRRAARPEPRIDG